MTWKRESANIAAQVIQRRSRFLRIRQLKEIDERGLRPVSHPARLVLGQRLERLLEAAKFEGRKTFLGEDVGEAEGELLFISSHHHQNLNSHEVLPTILHTWRGRVGSRRIALTHDYKCTGFIMCCSGLLVIRKLMKL